MTDWLKTFPYKWQVVEIALGLTALVTGAIFLLISVGLVSPLWKILAATCLCIGVVCTLMGVVWCWLSVRRMRNDPDMYGKVKECEVTITSEATEMIR